MQDAKGGSPEGVSCQPIAPVYIEYRRLSEEGHRLKCSRADHNGVMIDREHGCRNLGSLHDNLVHGEYLFVLRLVWLSVVVGLLLNAGIPIVRDNQDGIIVQAVQI